MRSKTFLSITGLVGLHLILLCAGFFAPYDPTAQDRELPYAPPTRMHFEDGYGFHFRPFVYAWTTSLDSDQIESYREDRTRRYPVHFFVSGSSYNLLGGYRTTLHLFDVESPGKILLFGADGYGRDEFSRVLFGGQISVAAGISATLIALLTGGLFGIVAGYFGRWVDEVLMGVTELFLSLPWLYFLLGVRAFLPLHLSTLRTFFLLTGVIGLIGWARPARLVRGLVLSSRHRNYVLAARGFGGSDFYLLRRHLLPEVSGLLLTQATLLVPRYIAAEVTLSFFGLGVNEPVPSWGNMLATLQQYNVLVSYGWLLAPACALVVTSVLYSSLADMFHSRLKSYST
ncbi:MAG TPA: ABC transporter permease [Terriglobales bacterium]|jgi:peptide/nickel transport system permease protein|nr:ABC transporter permease [Terriglobales bacterium]